MVTIKIAGLKELEHALAELPKATAKNVLVRGMKKAAEPVVAAANANAPDDPDTPGKSIRFVSSTQLTPRQKSLNRKREDKAFAELYVGQEGAGPNPVQQEFGNVNHGPQPSLRPAWDAGQAGVLSSLSQFIKTEIEKSAARLAAKAARATKG